MPPTRTQPKHRKSAIAVAPVPPPGRAVRLILIVVLAATPLALITGIFLSHDVIPKVILILSGAALLLFLMPQWERGLSILWNRPAGRLFLLLAAAQLISLLVSTLFSSRVSLSVAGTVWRRFGLSEQAAILVVATAVACAAVLWQSFIPTLIRAVTVCGGLAGLYGILQYFNLDPFLDRKLYSIDYFGTITRPPATMGHALYFSAYLIPVVFLASASVLSETARAWRNVHAAVVVVASAAILLSGTRSTVIALSAAAILFGWRALRRRGRGFSLKYAVIPVLALTGAAIFVVSPAGANLRHRLLQFQTERGGPRLQMWRESPALIAEHPWIGSGPETFAAQFRKIQSAELSRAYPDFYNETPHNALIDAASGQGIPGLLILIGLFSLGWWIGTGGAAIRNPLRIGLEAALLGILISSMFASLVLVTALLLWSTVGLAVALRPAAAEPKSAFVLHLPRAAAVLLGGVFLVVAASLSIQDAAWADLGSAASRKDLSGATQSYSTATSFLIRLPGYELWASQTMAALGRALGDTPEGAAAWKKSAEAAALAETRSEEPFDAAYQSSVLAVAAADIPRAEVKARETIRLAPNWYKGHLLLSQILQIPGKSEEAAREARLSENLGWKKQ